MFDVTVCGAGPIGSYIAWKFSTKGYKTLIIEEHKKPGLPLSCSGLVSTRLWNFIPKKSFLIERKILGARIHIFNNTYTFNSKQSVLIDRTKLDQYLFSLAESSGAKYLFKTHLNGFFEKKDDVSLYTSSPSKSHFQTKILAGCDGPLSTVRSSLGISNPNFLQAMFCYTNETPDSYVDLYFKETPDFFAWRIPRFNTVEYGLASKSHAKYYFKKFIKKHKIKPKKIFSGLIPFGLLQKTTSSRVFLCGDAASQTKPYTGGGIVYGLTCADIASSTIDPDNPDLSLYEKIWRKKLSKQIVLGTLIKRSYQLPAPLLDFTLNLLLKKQNLDMDMPSTIFR